MLGIANPATAKAIYATESALFIVFQSIYLGYFYVIVISDNKVNYLFTFEATKKVLCQIGLFWGVWVLSPLKIISLNRSSTDEQLRQDILRTVHPYMRECV